MHHCFSVKVAEVCGVHAAILFQNIAFWCGVNEQQNLHFHDGRFWTFSTQRDFEQQFPYLTRQNIRTALRSLADAGLILIGHFNQKGYDRTQWYALTGFGQTFVESVETLTGPDKINQCNVQNQPMESTESTNGMSGINQCNVQNQPMEDAESTNGKSKINQPIPNITTDITADITADASPRPAKRKTSIPPALEEVQAYCAERGNTVDAERFFDYYEARGWLIGKTKMKDWRAAVRSWERNEARKPQSAPPAQRSQRPPQRSSADDFSQSSFTDEDLEALVNLF